MRILIVAVGTRMPAWVGAGFEDYRARMPREVCFELIEVKPERRAAGMPVERLLAAERERIRAALPKGCCTVVLDERGRALTSGQLAAQLRRWREAGRDLAFVIGGADGIAAEVKSQADMLLSLSPMTLPHGLARVALAEQLYRAHTISSGHPYHRA
jgi:23S rRNA (pseudouridine1915-N3)-methyltransferase